MLLARFSGALKVVPSKFTCIFFFLFLVCQLPQPSSPLITGKIKGIVSVYSVHIKKYLPNPLFASVPNLQSLRFLSSFRVMSPPGAQSPRACEETQLKPSPVRSNHMSRASAS